MCCCNLLEGAGLHGRAFKFPRLHAAAQLLAQEGSQQPALRIALSIL